MKWQGVIAGLCSTLIFPVAGAQTATDEAGLGRVLAAVQAHAREAGDRLFPGYSRAPFGLLLEMNGHEILLCHLPVADFTADGVEPATGCTRQVRAGEHYSDKALAALPVLGTEPVIVMGTPQSTGLTQAQWVRTLYHEHFHQYEDSLPGYYERVKALDLAGDDRTGMWMMNYPFPYGDTRVQAAYRTATKALAEAVEARGSDSFKNRVEAYGRARAVFAQSVPDPAWRYFEFQLWHEGTAQWMEVALGKTDADPAVRESAEQLEQWSLEQLRTANLAERKRAVVYTIGEAEAMLMEASSPAWRQDFPKTLAMGPLLRSHLGLSIQKAP